MIKGEVKIVLIDNYTDLASLGRPFAFCTSNKKFYFNDGDQWQCISRMTDLADFYTKDEVTVLLNSVGGSPDWSTVQNKPSTFPPSSHTHAQSEVTGLVTALGNKSDSTHNHDSAYEAKNANIQAHISSAHAPSNAQKNSDILKAEIEAVLTGAIPTHTHNYAAPSHSHAQSDVTGLTASLNAKEGTIAAGSTGQYYRGDKTFQTLDKTAVGLANVDNTSDTNKPVSTATQTALNGKEGSLAAGIAGQYYRGDKTWATHDKASVGLGNVDNTADSAKPVSTAAQTALNAKENSIAAGTTAQYYRGDKSWQALDKAAVGLANVDNVSDANKPISSATQTALNAKAPLASPTFTGTVSGITPAMVGLGNCDNVSDVNKPVSTATQNALNLKANLTSPAFTTPNLGVATGTSLAVTGVITSSGNGIGYTTGAGGTVIQATGKTTGVTLSKLCGTIQMAATALATQTTAAFVLTNTFIAATDTVIVYHSATGTMGAYNVAVTPAAGSATIHVRNIHTASLTEAIVLRFAVIKAVTA
jgi:hypothetical protein